MDNFSFMGNGDVSAIEELYESYLSDDTSVDETWKKFFEGFEFARKAYDIQGGEAGEDLHKEFKVINLINGYRSRGHLFTKTNPVRTRRQYKPNLDLETFGLKETDMDTVFQAGEQIGMGTVRLRDIVTHLKRTYCQSIGVEYTYIRIPKIADWLRNRIEPGKNKSI